jgi:5-methylcytosine-specific restriction endonuclease McrA
MYSVPQSKQCVRCREVKSLDKYRKASKEKDGFQDCCRDCMKEKWAAKAHAHPDNKRTAAATARWRARHPEKASETLRVFRKKYPERVNEKNRRQHARRKELSIVPFTMEQLEAKLSYWGHRCWMCGNPAECVDHVKPQAKRGAHILANLRPACKKCNSRKNDKWPFPLIRNTPWWND